IYIESFENSYILLAMKTTIPPEKAALPLCMYDAMAAKLQQFAKEALQNGKSYAACTLPIDLVDPLSCLHKSWNKEKFHYYWEKPTENFAITAGNELLNLHAKGKNRFASISQQCQEIDRQTAVFKGAPHAYGGLILLGGFSFFQHIEHPQWKGFDAASFTIPEWLVFKDDKYALTTINVEIKDTDSTSVLCDRIITKFKQIEDRLLQALNHSFNNTALPTSKGSFVPNHPSSASESWVSSVNQAKTLISQNEFDKIVLARQLSIPHKGQQQAPRVLHNLRNHYFNCSCFLIHPPGGNIFLGATPENLGSFHNNLILTEALAGSIERGSTPQEDAMFANNLNGSNKNRAEHGFVVQDIRQRLEPLTNTIKHGLQPQIKKLSNVQHLHTPIRAHLADGISPLQAVEHLHPT